MHILNTILIIILTGCTHTSTPSILSQLYTCGPYVVKETAHVNYMGIHIKDIIEKGSPNLIWQHKDIRRALDAYGLIHYSVKIKPNRIDYIRVLKDYNIIASLDMGYVPFGVYRNKDANYTLVAAHYVYIKRYVPSEDVFVISDSVRPSHNGFYYDVEPIISGVNAWDPVVIVTPKLDGVKR